MKVPGCKMSYEKINNSNFKVLPEEDYYVQYEGLKYKDNPIMDYGRMFCHLDRIILRGSKKQQNKAMEMYDEQLGRFMNADLHKVMPEEFPPATERANKLFHDFYSANFFKDVTLPTGEVISVLDKNKCSEEEYNKAIRNWELEYRKCLMEDLGETWCWEDDRTGQFLASVEYHPKLMSPATIPSWIFAANTFNEVNFHNLTNIEMVALSHAIWFTLHKYSTGYVECSGHVEQWCRCDVNDVHKAFQSLYHRELLLEPLYHCADVTQPLTRNWGWMANVVYIQQVLSNYGREIDR